MQDKMLGVVGSGAMGSGIAQVAASKGWHVYLYDLQEAALAKASAQLKSNLNKLEEKGKIASASAILEQITTTSNINDLSNCNLIIEAVVEKLEVKKQIFAQLETIVSPQCILASNTSSLSITSIAAACQQPERVIGLHFFNPPPLMALVEVIPAIQTEENITTICTQWMNDWGKLPVITKDTPGFIVNRVARPFYGEALRIYEEGIASKATIDWAMTAIGGFKMGPFTLMDYIGHDVNYVVTETVFEAFYYDPKYKPSLSQKRLLEAGWLGRKTGRGFYNYAENAVAEKAVEDQELGQKIVDRIVAMLIHEAVEALHLNIASAEDLDTAMTKGVNYPKGLLAWCSEIGAKNVLKTLDDLYNHYHEDRYRASVLLRKMAEQ